MNKYRRAVGLEYNPAQDPAPLLNIKGEDYGADEIVKVARRFGVPVVENPQVARSLGLLELGQSIPQALFEAVAIILASIRRWRRNAS